MTESMVLTLIAIAFVCAFSYVVLTLWEKHKKRIAREAKEKRKKELFEQNPVNKPVNFFEQMRIATKLLQKCGEQVGKSAERLRESTEKLKVANQKIMPITQTYSNLPPKDHETKRLEKHLAFIQKQKEDIIQEIENNEGIILDNLERPSPSKIN